MVTIFRTCKQFLRSRVPIPRTLFVSLHMSSFAAFRLSAELKKAGLTPSGVSLAAVASACARFGAQNVAEMIGMNLAETPEMDGMPEPDRRNLQAGLSLLVSHSFVVTYCFFRKSLTDWYQFRLI